MNSTFYLKFSRVFVLGAYLNAILAFVSYLIGAERILTLCSFALTLACAAFSITFFIVYERIAKKEDEVVMDEINKFLGDKDE